MVAEGTASETRGAVRFFWTWLFLATTVSVAGNVAHAVLTAPPGIVRLAAAAAVVPPAVLLGATHSVALLVKTRRVGVIYWCALAMTFALAACAFILSFDALRGLAVALGMAPSRAWLWPVAIDVSIANSTLSLLSLSPPRTVPSTAVPADDAAQPSPVVAHSSSAPASDSARGGSVAPACPARGRSTGRRTADEQPGTAQAQLDAPHAEPDQPAAAAASAPGSPTDLRQWRSAADQLVRDGVTSKDPTIVATVLAEQAAGTAPSTIGRRHNLHHSTVGRILEGHARRNGVSVDAQCLTG